MANVPIGKIVFEAMTSVRSFAKAIEIIEKYGGTIDDVIAVLNFAVVECAERLQNTPSAKGYENTNVRAIIRMGNVIKIVDIDLEQFAEDVKDALTSRDFVCVATSTEKTVVVLTNVDIDLEKIDRIAKDFRSMAELVKIFAERDSVCTLAWSAVSCIPITF